MPESSLFWTTGSTGDGASAYTQTQLFAMFSRMLLNDATAQGVIAGYTNKLAVSGTASPLSVATGAAFVYGIPYENATSSVSLTVTTPSVGTTGGRVNLRADWTAQTVRAVVVRNTDGTSAIPALTQNAGVQWEIPLATFTITTGGVITLTDARQFIYDTFFNRQGGDATNFATAGTTNYPISGDMRIQVGTVTVPANPTTVTVTFPVAFSGTPVVFLQNAANGISGQAYLQGPATTTQVVIWQNGGTTNPVHWVAIGPV